MKKEYSESTKNEYQAKAPRKLERPVPYEVASPAVMMMTEILLTIAVRHYGVKTGDVLVTPVTLNDGGFDLSFSGNKEDIVDEVGFADPDDYDRFVAMFRDLKSLNDDPNILIHPEILTVIGGSKMALYKLLVDFMDEDNLCMTTLDDSSLVNPNGEDIIPTLRNMFQREPEKYREELIESGKREMEIGACASVFCHSIEDFYIQILKAEAADVPISMQHLLKTIQEEDHALPKDVNRHNFVMGGYN